MKVIPYRKTLGIIFYFGAPEVCENQRLNSLAVVQRSFKIGEELRDEQFIIQKHTRNLI